MATTGRVERTALQQHTCTVHQLYDMCFIPHQFPDRLVAGVRRFVAHTGNIGDKWTKAVQEKGWMMLRWSSLLATKVHGRIHHPKTPRRRHPNLRSTSSMSKPSQLTSAATVQRVGIWENRIGICHPSTYRL
jgi:hypothetical protein